MFQNFLQSWFQSKAGQQSFASEKDLLVKQLDKVFGYYLVQLGHPYPESFLATSRVAVKLLLDEQENSLRDVQQVLADLDYLPFRKDSLDAVLLPHTLETVADPYHLIRQVDDILRSDGHLIITGFNPWGLKTLVARWGKNRQDFAQAHFLRLNRLVDWLNLLGYEIRLAQYEAGYSWLDKVGVHLGGVYILVAKKRVSSPLPVGLNWKLANWLPFGKPQVAPSYKRNKQNKNIGKE